MLKYGKRFWALLLAAAMLMTQGAAAAAPENGAAAPTQAQPSAPFDAIGANEARALVNEAGAAGRGYVLAAAGRPAAVRVGAWAALGQYPFAARTLSNGTVRVQVTLPQPARLTRDLWVSGWTDGPEALRVRSLFDRHFKNVVLVVHLDEQGDWGPPAEIAVRPPAGCAVQELVFYSYNAAANTCRRIPAPAPRIDGGGWLHFTTPFAGDLILSRGELEKRGSRAAPNPTPGAVGRDGDGGSGNQDPPAGPVDVTDAGGLLSAMQSGAKEIRLLPSAAPCQIGGIDADGVQIAVTGGASLELNGTAAGRGVQIDVDSGARMTGYENIGAGNTVKVAAGAALSPADAGVPDLVGGDKAFIRTSGRVVIRGKAAGYDINIEGDAILRQGEAEGGRKTMTLKDGVNLNISGKVTLARPVDDTLTLNIEEGAGVLVDGILVVEDIKSVGGGEHIRGDRDKIVNPDGAPVGFPDPQPDAIFIRSVEQIENMGFRVVLSAPTGEALGLDAFFAKCPAQAELSLGRVETADNRTYEVYMKEGWSFLPRNTYAIRVTLHDGVVLTGQFYALTYPSIGLISAARALDQTVTVAFASDQAGDVYYGTCAAKADAPRNVDEVIAHGSRASLAEGENTLTLPFVPAGPHGLRQPPIPRRSSRETEKQADRRTQHGTTL